jgi:hypothetical protein
LYLFHPSSQSSKHPVSHPEKPEKEGKNTKWYNNAREDPALEHQGHEKKRGYMHRKSTGAFSRNEEESAPEVMRRRKCPTEKKKKKKHITTAK